MHFFFIKVTSVYVSVNYIWQVVKKIGKKKGNRMAW